MVPPPPDCETARSQKVCRRTGIVPVSEVQNNLRSEAKMLGRFMRTDEGEKLLAFALPKVYWRCFRTRHGRLPMRTEDGGHPTSTWWSPKEELFSATLY